MHLRTGLLGETEPSAAARSAQRTMLACLSVLSQQATRVAGEYALGCARNEVTGEDMRRALMYTTRVYFATEEFDAQVVEECKAMAEESEESEGEESEGEESEGEESEGEESEGGEFEAAARDVDKARAAALVTQVDTIAATWHLWHPTDPAHQLLKRAIDATPVD